MDAPHRMTRGQTGTVTLDRHDIVPLGVEVGFWQDIVPLAAGGCCQDIVPLSEDA